jgi:hypothetical protein
MGSVKEPLLPLMSHHGGTLNQFAKEGVILRKNPNGFLPYRPLFWPFAGLTIATSFSYTHTVCPFF